MTPHGYARPRARNQRNGRSTLMTRSTRSDIDQHENYRKIGETHFAYCENFTRMQILKSTCSKSLCTLGHDCDIHGTENHNAMIDDNVRDDGYRLCRNQMQIFAQPEDDFSSFGSGDLTPTVTCSPLTGKKHLKLK